MLTAPLFSIYSKHIAEITLIGWGLLELFPGSLARGDRPWYALNRVSAFAGADSSNFSGHPHVFINALLGLFGALALMVTAIVLFRPRSTLARLYSIAVAPHMAGRGIGPMLLQAAEDVARSRHATAMRLEVHHTNQAAISRYRKSGYREFGRHRCYYEDGADALRFEKRLIPDAAALRNAPPYFHQTTDFTCGDAMDDHPYTLHQVANNHRPGPAIRHQNISE